MNDAIDCEEIFSDNGADCEICPNKCIRLDMCEYCICPMECNNFRQVMDTSGQFRWI